MSGRKLLDPTTYIYSCRWNFINNSSKRNINTLRTDMPNRHLHVSCVVTSCFWCHIGKLTVYCCERKCLSVIVPNDVKSWFRILKPREERGKKGKFEAVFGRVSSTSINIKFWAMRRITASFVSRATVYLFLAKWPLETYANEHHL